MNKTNLPVIVIVVAVFLALGLAARDVRSSLSASSNNNVKSVGFGNLRALENSQSNSITEKVNSASGFGNLRVYEYQQAYSNPNTAARPAGFGNLRQIEALQSSDSNPSYAGMGDLHLFEARQARIR